MITRQGYEAYKLYLALQRHFSTSYCFFKYNGKVKVSKEAYQRRNDVFSFEKLVKIVPQEDLVDFYVAHFLKNNKEWIRNMSKQGLEKYRSVFKNLPIKFKEDLEYIKLYDPREMLKSTSSEIPLIHDKVMCGDLSIESIIILDSIYPFVEKHEEKVNISFVWPDHIEKIKKYKPFVLQKIQLDLYKSIAKEVLL